MRMHSSSLLSVFNEQVFGILSFSPRPISQRHLCQRPTTTTSTTTSTTTTTTTTGEVLCIHYYHPSLFKTNMHSHHLFSTGKLWSALSLGKLSFSPTYLGQRPTTTTGQSAGHFCFVVCFQLAFWAFLVDFSTRY